MDKLLDKRVNCYSIIKTVTVKNYLDLVERSYQDRGGLEGQRNPLKSTTAIRIRKRMIEDLKRGAVLPPIVLGFIVGSDEFDLISTGNEDQIQGIIEKAKPEDIVIIDGMQRTTALRELERELDQDIVIRVEYWISTNTNSLIYRMLVLNTGQVPWNLRRQIEVVFSPMIEEIKKNVEKIDIILIEDNRRRVQSGQYHASDLLELFLVFGARKEKIDTQERLADEFTRLDFIEATAESNFSAIFYEALQLMVNFDHQFGRYLLQNGDDGRFSDGKDLFRSQPARVGFLTAIAVSVFGRPGAEFKSEQQILKWDSIKKNSEILLGNLNGKESNQIGDFLDFQTLNEVLHTRTHSSLKVGDIEREFFNKAFRTLIDDEFKVASMTACWRAY